jgi:hypothetical protein
MGIAINFCRNLFLLASFAGYIVPRCRSSSSQNNGLQVQCHSLYIWKKSYILSLLLSFYLRKT